jgi:aminopeptidase N
VQHFFDEWIYGAGAPKFDISYTYDDAKRQIALSVKQTQKVEGRVGVFQVPVDIEVVTASGSKLHTVHISKESQAFAIPADAPPLMVIFDKGGRLLKLADFHKEKKEWLYQLKNATDVADRADAIAALGKMKNDDEALAALGNAASTDKAWGVRDIAADALGRMANAGAAKQLLDALNSNEQPFVRNHIVAALGEIKDEPNIAARLETIARDDASYRARANALQSLGHLKAPDALNTLTAVAKVDSPDHILRNAALRSLGYLADDKAVPLLREWGRTSKHARWQSRAWRAWTRATKRSPRKSRNLLRSPTIRSVTLRSIPWAAVATLLRFRRSNRC